MFNLLTAFIFIELSRSDGRLKKWTTHSKIGILSENNMGNQKLWPVGHVGDITIRGQQSQGNPTYGTGGRLMLKADTFCVSLLALGASALPKDRCIFHSKIHLSNEELPSPVLRYSVGEEGTEL